MTTHDTGLLTREHKRALAWREPIRLHQRLHHDLHLPRGLTDQLVRAVRFLANPMRAIAARRLAPAAAGGPALAMDPAGGYCPIAPSDLPGMNAMMAAARRAFDAAEAEGRVARSQQGAKKRFLLPVLDDEGLIACPELLAFAIGRPILDLAAEYLGAVPLISGVRLLWTPPNDTVVDSQLYHRDAEDARQVKLFVNLQETTPEHGPFTFLPADVSARIRDQLGYKRGRISDQDIEGKLEGAAPIVLTGPAGSGAFVDTSRCLHFGSRGNTRGRLILQIQLTSLLAPKARQPNWAKVVGRMASVTLDPVQRVALGLR
jgi:hypothetical protein